jgi:hypothetical protein
MQTKKSALAGRERLEERGMKKRDEPCGSQI